jgi:ABC-2 type transport system permease protein
MWQRIWAVFLRHLYLHRRSPARIMEIFFWPVMDLLVWGFITLYLKTVAVPEAVLFFIGAMIFWDVLYRSQQAISLSMTEEFWVRNFINIFISPLSIPEFIAALCLVGLLKSLLTTIFLAFLAVICYSFNLLQVGLALVPFLGNLLLFGWAVGLVTMGVILRYGRAAEALIWGMPFLLQPISAVFYPLETLPQPLQLIAACLPSTYVFEGMRNVLSGQGFSLGAMQTAFLLNLGCLAAGGVFFGWMLKSVRERGYLSRQHLH